MARLNREMKIFLTHNLCRSYFRQYLHFFFPFPRSIIFYLRMAVLFDAETIFLHDSLA